MNKEFREGILLGSKHYAKINTMSDRWKKRNVPAFIRKALLVPYYITEVNGWHELHIIQFPICDRDKVEFIPFARSRIHEKECSEISDSKK
ncbi:hypothetical protein DYBT9275_00893 [Dyadobacter sp. CECT 9275]|uniref:Uncharacterized protein n=1 Tax=Dyadobacter helix TaxID=2822344 RepID=A0A916NB60_9BACT|nr:hypothetical protein [Dyadobacter sp. CECT 9275]CAG4992097.1 hypothetical protein DYBT9275_00893 [Dyadobacter sp. CECT 9275]